MEPNPATAHTYRRPARILHWLTVALLALQIPVGFWMTYRGGQNLWDALTGALYHAHKLVGLAILALVVVRYGYRLIAGAPPDEPTLTPWQRWASRLNHYALYLLLLVTPVLGYVGISLFPALRIGPISLPAVTAPDKQAAEAVLAAHGILAALLVALVALHVAAALYHYFVRRDGVMARMLPRLARR